MVNEEISCDSIEKPTVEGKSRSTFTSRDCGPATLAEELAEEAVAIILFPVTLSHSN